MNKAKNIQEFLQRNLLMDPAEEEKSPVLSSLKKVALNENEFAHIEVKSSPFIIFSYFLSLLNLL